MDVASDDERRVQFDQVWLRNEYSLTFLYEHLDLTLCQIDLLEAEVLLILFDLVAHLKQGVDDAVQLVMVN